MIKKKIDIKTRALQYHRQFTTQWKVFAILFSLIPMLVGCVGNKELVYLQDKDLTSPHKKFESSEHAIGLERDTIRPGDYLFVRLNRLTIGQELIQVGDIEQARNLQITHPYRFSYLVSDSGEVYIPAIGRVKAEGLNIIEFQTLVQSIAQRSLPDAAVEAHILNHFVTFLGEVNNPGRVFLYDHKVNVLELIALAGGLNDYADRKKVKVVRETASGERVFHIDLTDLSLMDSQEFYPEPGDVLVVSPLRRKVFENNRAQLFLSALTTLVAVTSLVITATSN